MWIEKVWFVTEFYWCARFHRPARWDRRNYDWKKATSDRKVLPVGLFLSWPAAEFYSYTTFLSIDAIALIVLQKCLSAAAPTITPVQIYNVMSYKSGYQIQHRLHHKMYHNHLIFAGFFFYFFWTILTDVSHHFIRLQPFLSPQTG